MMLLDQGALDMGQDRTVGVDADVPLEKQPIMLNLTNLRLNSAINVALWHEHPGVLNKSCPCDTFIHSLTNHVPSPNGPFCIQTGHAVPKDLPKNGQVGTPDTAIPWPPRHSGRHQNRAADESDVVLAPTRHVPYKLHLPVGAAS